jgi:hypothetical protein
VVGVLAAGLVLGAGCGSSSSSSGTSPSTSTKAPEDILVPDAEVTTGLATLGELTQTAGTQAKTDATAAKASADAVEEQWQTIEGRIKKNDTSAYLAFEDGLSDVRTGASEGDATRAAKGVAAVAAATTAYLAKYPG